MHLYILLKTQYLNNRMDAVNQKGVYLDNFITTKFKFNLYAIDKFFVEVTYEPFKNKITKVQSFNSGNLLDKYSNIESYFK
jgi:hypothetical protein